MDKTVDARILANIGMPHETLDSEEMDKYETTNQGFGNIVQKQNNNSSNHVASIKVKQYIPS